ncbi:MAG: adenylate kinase [Elusimicrobia bacterium CG06_land_8_20_14_3_00_38_11]|nr:MAG: adenylate kinase [Elusimicrobia bacterium CG06_land_8_20_14_3_00_38_11]
MNLIIFGAPGAGKGTQAEFVSKEKGIPSISTGEIFREAVAAKTPLGIKIAEIMSKGSLVSDGIVLKIVEERIKKDDCKNGFLLDGFPRTLPQAKGFDNLLLASGKKIDEVISLDVAEENIVQRLTSRRICKKCGAKFNLETLPPKIDGVCDNCGGELFQREDDMEKTIRHRLSVYYIETQPLIEYYKSKGILVTVDGNRSVSEISQDIASLL